jgi:hypothetical protein
LLLATGKKILLRKVALRYMQIPTMFLSSVSFDGACIPSNQMPLS